MKFCYTYDNMERLLTATVERDGTGPVLLCGNTLVELSLSHDGNQLWRVTDQCAGLAYEGAMDFRDGADAGRGIHLRRLRQHDQRPQQGNNRNQLQRAQPARGGALRRRPRHALHLGRRRSQAARGVPAQQHGGS